MFETFSAYVQLGAFVLQMVFLALGLSAAGVAVNRLINAFKASRATPSMKRADRIESARTRAQARARQTAQSF